MNRYRNRKTRRLAVEIAMTPDHGQDPVNPANPPPASAPAPTTKIFSEAEVQAALARLKAKAAAQRTADGVPQPPDPCEAVEKPDDEAAVNPEEARRQFEVVIADLRAAFAKFVAAKEEQFEQVADLGWSGEHEDVASFLRHLEQERERLRGDTAQIHSDILSSAEANELAEIDEKLAEMKPTWDKLRAEGVPIDERPLTDLPWSVQFQFQAEADPSGKDMEWWKAHKDDVADLE